MLVQTKRRALVSLLLLISLITTLLTTLAQSAPIDKYHNDNEGAKIISLPQSNGFGLRVFQITINCKTHPFYCQPTTTYKLTKIPFCPSKTDPTHTITLTQSIEWVIDSNEGDMNYKELMTLIQQHNEADSKDILLLKNPFSTDKPIDPIPDSIKAFVSIRQSSLCQNDEKISSVIGTFEIGYGDDEQKNDIIEGNLFYSNIPIPWHNTRDDISQQSPIYNMTIAYNHKKNNINGNTIIPFTIDALFHSLPDNLLNPSKTDYIELIPHGHQQFSADLALFDGIKCTFGDALQAKENEINSMSIIGIWKKSDYGNYYAVRVPIGDAMYKPGFEALAILPIIMKCQITLPTTQYSSTPERFYAQPLPNRQNWNDVSLRFVPKVSQDDANAEDNTVMISSSYRDKNHQIFSSDINTYDHTVYIPTTNQSLNVFTRFAKMKNNPINNGIFENTVGDKHEEDDDEDDEHQDSGKDTKDKYRYHSLTSFSFTTPHNTDQELNPDFMKTNRYEIIMAGSEIDQLYLHHQNATKESVDGELSFTLPPMYFTTTCRNKVIFMGRFFHTQTIQIPQKIQSSHHTVNNKINNNYYYAAIFTVPESVYVPEVTRLNAHCLNLDQIVTNVYYDAVTQFGTGDKKLFLSSNHHHNNNHINIPINNNNLSTSLNPQISTTILNAFPRIPYFDDGQQFTTTRLSSIQVTPNNRISQNSIRFNNNNNPQQHYTPPLSSQSTLPTNLNFTREFFLTQLFASHKISPDSPKSSTGPSPSNEKVTLIDFQQIDFQFPLNSKHLPNATLSHSPILSTLYNDLNYNVNDYQNQDAQFLELLDQQQQQPLAFTLDLIGHGYSYYTTSEQTTLQCTFRHKAVDYFNATVDLINGTTLLFKMDKKMTKFPQNKELFSFTCPNLYIEDYSAPLQSYYNIVDKNVAESINMGSLGFAFKAVTLMANNTTTSLSYPQAITYANCIPATYYNASLSTKLDELTTTTVPECDVRIQYIKLTRKSLRGMKIASIIIAIIAGVLGLGLMANAFMQPELRRERRWVDFYEPIPEAEEYNEEQDANNSLTEGLTGNNLQ